MEINETLKDIMKKNPVNYNMLFEVMRRKVSKGLITGVTTEAFDAAVDSLTTVEEEKEETPEDISARLTRNVFELSEAIDKYGCLDEEESDEELETKILQEFYENAIKLDNSLLSEGIISGAIKAVGNAAKTAVDFIKSPVGIAGAAGTGIGLAAAGVGALIHKLRKRKKNKNLQEDSGEFLFSNENLEAVRECLDHMRDNDINSLSALNEDMNELIREAKIFKPLNENVTYVTNSGSLKTASAEDYAKDMHLYGKDLEEDKKKKKKLTEADLSSISIADFLKEE